MRPADFLDVNAALTDPTPTDAYGPGFIEYECRMAIRDMFRVFPDEQDAIRKINFIIDDELTNRPRDWRKS